MWNVDAVAVVGIGNSYEIRLGRVHADPALFNFGPKFQISKFLVRIQIVVRLLCFIQKFQLHILLSTVFVVQAAIFAFQHFLFYICGNDPSVGPKNIDNSKVNYENSDRLGDFLTFGWKNWVNVYDMFSNFCNIFYF